MPSAHPGRVAKVEYLVIAMRLLHIVFGAIWIGFAVFVPFILMPALVEAGPAAAPVMAAIQRRGYVKVIGAVSGISVVAGVWLLWRVSGGFRPEFMGSHMGIALSIGALATIVAYAVGTIMIGPNMQRAATLSQGLASITADSERSTTLAQIGALRARGALGGRLTAILLLFAVAAMSIARYV